MTRKLLIPLVCLIASINCQGGFLSSLANIQSLSSLIPNVLDEVSKLLNSLLAPKQCHDEKVKYPFIIENSYDCLNRSSPPPLELHLGADIKIAPTYYPAEPWIFSSSRQSIFVNATLTGGLLNDGHDNKFLFKNVQISWKHNYTSPYTVGNIRNPIGHVRYIFVSLYRAAAPFPKACYFEVDMYFFIAIGKETDKGLDNFLKIIEDARAGSKADTDLTDYFYPFQNTTFNKPYYLYNNVGDNILCSTNIVFPEYIHISQSQFNKTFGTDNRPSKNIFTPIKNDTKTVYYVQPRAKTGGLKIIPYS